MTAYDKWGRLSEHARGKLRETYSYDHFGRLAEKDEGGTVYAYAYDAYGNRTSRTVTGARGTSTERRAYDAHGRLAAITEFGKTVKFFYDAKGRLSRQVVDGSPIDFAYTKYGQLAGKYLGGRDDPDAAVEYEYAKSGHIVARTANGVRQTYEYDGRGQLLAVKENGADVERYSYDKAGNMVRKTVRGKTTTFAFDGANQLVSSTTDGVTTRYAYDAAGRLVREGDRVYRYGYLDKVLSVTEGERKYTYDYHVDGQLARADYGNAGRAGCPQPAGSEDFLWDGLALIRRGDESFVNEPHVGGGNPILSSKGVAYFNDMLGTTVGAWDGRTAQKRKAKRRYSAAALTAFGESLSASQPLNFSTSQQFFTGKPQVDGLGHAFLFRNYRAALAKWQTADPLGYPDGWNQLAYCGNGTSGHVDYLGAVKVLCYDLNDCGRMKDSELFLRMVEGESSGFTFAYSEYVDSGSEITINLNVSLHVTAGLRENADFGYGDITEYKPHTGSNNDSVFNYPVYEAVCAHERGHAASFFSDFVPYFTQLLESRNLDSYSGGADANIQSVIDVCYQEAIRHHLPNSNAMANIQTYFWFAGHQEWKYIGSHYGFDRWVKE